MESNRPDNLHKGSDPSKYEVDIEDMIEKSGCSEVYYKLEECLGEHDRDWTKCQVTVKALQACSKHNSSYVTGNEDKKSN
jgi:hypothetical protein